MTINRASLICFRLFFFTLAVIASIVDFTNIYAGADGSWQHSTAAEIGCLFLYCGLVQVPNLTGRHYHYTAFGPAILSPASVKALLAFVHVVSPGDELPGDKLKKVRFLYKAILAKCCQHYQPHQEISIDERMVVHKEQTAVSSDFLFVTVHHSKSGLSSSI